VGCEYPHHGNLARSRIDLYLGHLRIECVAVAPRPFSILEAGADGCILEAPEVSPADDGVAVVLPDVACDGPRKEIDLSISFR
jgi:hypothetical protein